MKQKWIKKKIKLEKIQRSGGNVKKRKCILQTFNNTKNVNEDKNKNMRIGKKY
jgi:hypothetical protein